MSPIRSEPRAAARIAVVIPYFQREPGLLRRGELAACARQLRDDPGGFGALLAVIFGLSRRPAG